MPDGLHTRPVFARSLASGSALGPRRLLFHAPGLDVIGQRNALQVTGWPRKPGWQFEVRKRRHAFGRSENVLKQEVLMKHRVELGDAAPRGGAAGTLIGQTQN